jgi:hypothetical protein
LGLSRQRSVFADNDSEILAERQYFYIKAKQRNFEGWNGDIRNWKPIKEVYLNPEKKVRDGKRQSGIKSI